MRERHIFKAWPLTPIHIGTGEELTPESFVLDGDKLRPINGFSALSGATDAERAHYQKLLKGGDLIGAQNYLTKLAKQAGSAGETIGVSPDTMRDLERVLNGKSLARGSIKPFIRDGGAPILPGSSLKGAFRTAWIDQALEGANVPKPPNTNRTRQEARALNDRALGLDKPSALEQDPFRDVAVVDAPIPLGRTRYDRATLGKLDRAQAKLNFDQTGGIQMHVERLLSLADGGVIEPFDVRIDIAAELFIKQRMAMGMRGDRRIVPKRAIGARDLWAVANRFHADLWLYEWDRFYKDSPAAPLLDSLLKTFGLTGDDSLNQQLDTKGFILLRVGRYSQFESKAVRLNDRRYGVKAATRGRNAKDAGFMSEGGTRTTVKAVNDIAAPFGWLLLALPGKGPQGAVSAQVAGLGGVVPGTPQNAPGLGRIAAQPVSSQRALAGQFQFRRGDRIVHDDGDEGIVARDVSFADKAMDVDFDGEIEEVAIKGWKRK